MPSITTGTYDPACKIEATEVEALKNNCWPVPEVAENVNKDELGRLGLTEHEMDDIVAFMQTLTDGYMTDVPVTFSR